MSDAVLRTHPGLLPLKAAQVWSSRNATISFARMCRVHVALAPYRRGLMSKAEVEGTPLVRPLFFEFPTDGGSLDIWKVFMLGSELLVAPVLDAGAQNVEVYFPPLPPGAGRWIHVWSQEPVRATGTHAASAHVSAPLGQPAVFFKENSKVGAALADAMRTAAARDS